MGFFKDFKEDFSEAINDLVPGAEERSYYDAELLNTVCEEVDVKTELSKLDGLLEQASKKVDEPVAEAEPEAEAIAEEPAVEPTPVAAYTEPIKVEETPKMDTITPIVENRFTAAPAAPVSNETAIITSGMIIRGSVECAGAVDIQGTIEGDVVSNGKLTVTGTIVGNSSSAEFFADGARIQGEVNTTGTVKVGANSRIIGNIAATSAVIAGAVKGDIDVQGPVVVDTSAVVVGNIKSRSVQINNGAVIEGFCSQCYADIDMKNLFG